MKTKHVVCCCIWQGLMPKTNAELKFTACTIPRQHKLPTLECKDVRVLPQAKRNS